MKLPDRQWQNMDEAAIASADCSDWICVLPLGAHEQHGPHLPFETDAIIADGIASKLSKRLDPKLPVSIMPTEPIGYSVEHLDFPGSKSLSWEEALSRWIGIGETLSKFGIRKLLLLNAHGGNSPLMTIVATELRVQFAMLCVATSWTRFLAADPVIPEQEKAFGIHGGDIETSVMLALAPEQVDMSKAENYSSFQQELVQKNDYLRAYGPHAFGWKMQDLNAQGVTGDASQANVEKGEALLNDALQGIEKLVLEMHQFDLSHFEPRQL